MTILQVLVGWLDIGALVLGITWAKRYIFEREYLKKLEDELSHESIAYKLGFLTGLALSMLAWPITLLGFIWEIADAIIERKGS